ncbi:chitobiase/beta-hexosaminidase C-terminal domain-containing protein [candidate division KSB1 bacterium]|nr:chitobiase/beta-hexosaminidase C-terminal domain-containing protein [candidate division KSB1 bacterium]
MKLHVTAVLLMVFGCCCFADDYKPVPGKIMTPWAKDVDPSSVLPEYPRPQMVRRDWINLNGLWSYAIVNKDDSAPATYDGRILVPFAIESALSGVKKSVGKDNALWYSTTFDIPKNWLKNRTLLHFGAVDWEAAVFVNGMELGSHKGGYDAFTFDITEALNPKKPHQQLVIRVWDPTDDHTQPRGKQVNNPHAIWYTSVTGIWQTVWLESVPQTYIKSIAVVPDIDTGSVNIAVETSGRQRTCTILATAKDGWSTAGKKTGLVGKWLSVPIDKPKLWSPDSPFLYDLEIVLKDEKGKQIDKISSYFGMRKISLGRDKNSLVRIMLNDKFLFQLGLLDQGWWPDGLYTAPTDEALKYDIEITKKYGFNMARKHVKVEPDRWYYWADKLGLLVWQDMPSGDRHIGSNDPDITRTPDSSGQFLTELIEMIDQCANHPSIVIWVPFNEGWGQFETDEVSAMVKQLDPSRLVNSVSGWADRRVGDMHDIHVYPGPGMPPPEQGRAIVLGEFGGLGLPVADHTWQDKANWGYRSFEDADKLTEAYSDLIEKLYPMIDDGLSAAVYTQTTDVEIEVNGLLTYDRRVLKMDPEQVKKINDGFFAPIIRAESDIFLDIAKIEIIDNSKHGKIRFTTDSSEPTSSSKVYTDPIIIKKSTTIKAKTFWPDGSGSSTNQLKFRKVSLQEPVKAGSLQKGLEYEYIEDDGKSGSVTTGLAGLKPKFSGVTDKINTDLSSREEYFGLRFSGFIKAPIDGIYTFYTRSDDGSTLFIGDTQIVFNDYAQGMTERSGQIALKAGLHPIKIAYAQGQGGHGLEVYYKAPGEDKKMFGPDMLFH